MERAGAWVVVAIGLAIIAVVAYFGLKQMEPLPRAATPAMPEAASPATQSESTPEVRYPIQLEQSPTQTAREGEPGLLGAVTGLVSDKSLEALLNREDFVRRIVA